MPAGLPFRCTLPGTLFGVRPVTTIVILVLLLIIVVAALVKIVQVI